VRSGVVENQSIKIKKHGLRRLERSPTSTRQASFLCSGRDAGNPGYGRQISNGLSKNGTAKKENGGVAAAARKSLNSAPAI
jgi:hypothetical protein